MILLLGVLGACALDGEPSPATGTASAQLTPCDPTPYLTGFALTDLNKNPVTSISPNTNYLIQVCGKVSSVCLTLVGGGQLTGGLSPTTSCHDMSFPSPHTPGNVGATFFSVKPTGPGVALTGQVTPWDACSGEDPTSTASFSLPGINTCVPTTRRYVCGYALPGYGCDNGRRSQVVDAANITAAFAACAVVQLPGYTDRCYVLALDGEVPTDRPGCAAGGGSWRPRNNCCNIRGTKSCPL